MDDELTPQQTERVRRLLAESRHTEPIPDDVAARIDRALADAAAAPTGPAAPVVPLAQRRRRAGQLLLAAAAVVVGGVAVGQDVGDNSASDETAATDSSASSEAEGDELPVPDRDGHPTDRKGALQSEDAPVPGAVADSQMTVSKLAAREIRSDRFAGDAERLRTLATARRAAPYAGSAPPPAADLARGDGCGPGVWGGGRYVRVVFDQEAGWLVYRPPRGGTQVVDLFLCGEDAPERSATLPFD